jgi:hypothetical protein
MPGARISLAPGVVRLPAQIDLPSPEPAYGQVYAVLAAGEVTVIADLAATTCSDCCFLRRLVAVQHHAPSRASEPWLVIPPGGQVHCMAEPMGLDPLLPLRDLCGAAAVPLPRLNGPRSPGRATGGQPPWPTSAM